MYHAPRGLPLRETDGGGDTFEVPFFILHVFSRSQFFRPQVQGLIFKFLSILVHIFPFVYSRALKLGQMSVLGCKKCNVVFTLGSKFNCCNALGESFSVEPSGHLN